VRPVVACAIDAAQLLAGADEDEADDTIDRKEFHLMLRYLKSYCELMAIIEDAVKNDDTIDKGEFLANVPELQEWGLKLDDTEAAWSALDYNETGYATIEEYIDWALRTAIEQQPREPEPAPMPPKNVAKTIDWEKLSRVLPAKKGDRDSTIARKAMWNRLDFVGKNYITYQEAEEGIMGLLREAGSKGVLALNPKPAIRNAYEQAKGVHQAAGGNMSGCAPDDKGSKYVEKNEFRLLLAYLRYYFELYTIFQQIDSAPGGEDDDAISLEEFKVVFPQLLQWGADVKDGPEAAYKRLDTEGNGAVDFDHFLTWALKHQLDRDDDGEDEDENEDLIVHNP